MRKQELTVIAVAGLDVVSIIVKFALAMVTGSLSLLADAWHSMGDLATSIMVLIALVLDRRESKAGDEHEKKARFIRKSSWETRVCTVIGFALIAVAAGITQKVYTGSTLEVIKHPGRASIIVLFLMLLSHIRFKIEESVGRETNSPSLVADAYHSRVDIYVLSLVLVSFGAEMLRIRIDRWVAGFIALLIYSIAIRTLIRAMKRMFELSSKTAPDDRTVEDSVVLIMMGGFSSGKGVVTSFVEKLLRLDGPEKKRKFGRVAIGVISLSLIVSWLLTGCFVVQPWEQVIVERFGKPVNIETPATPGLHFDLPDPFSVVRRVDVRTVRRLQLGYKTSDRKDLILWTNAHYIEEFSVLAGDGSIVDFAANMHYRVKDAGKFLYSSMDPVESVTLIANEVLRDIAGTRPLFELLTHDRGTAEKIMQERVQSLVDKQELGLEILQMCFMDMHPPLEVAPAFEDVVSAQEELETFVEQARGYRKETLPLAHAEAYSKLSEAEAYKAEVLNNALGRAESFAKRSTAFKLHASVNRYRMRLQALETWMVDRKLWLVDSDALNNPLDIFVSPGGNSSAAAGFLERNLGGEDSFEP